MNIYDLLEEMTLLEAQLYASQGLIIECADGKAVGIHTLEGEDHGA